MSGCLRVLCPRCPDTSQHLPPLHLARALSERWVVVCAAEEGEEQLADDEAEDAAQAWPPVGLRFAPRFLRSPAERDRAVHDCTIVMTPEPWPT